MRRLGEILLALYCVLFGALTLVWGLLLTVAGSPRWIAILVGVSAVAGALMVMLGGGFALSRSGRTRRNGALALILGGVLGGGADGLLVGSVSYTDLSIKGDYATGVLVFGGIAIFSGLGFLGMLKPRIP